MLIAAVNSQCRLIFNAGREGLLPRWIGRVHPTRRTPVNAIITLGWALGHWFGGHSSSLDALNYFFESTKADPQWRAAMARRGYPDVSKIRTAPITAGVFGVADDDWRRMVRVLGEIAYLDATVTDDVGQPRTIPNAICIHEEDFGILWKHTDIFNGSAQSRRQRRLVVSYFTPFHQHLFSARLDMTVDGLANAVPPTTCGSPGTIRPTAGRPATSSTRTRAAPASPPSSPVTRTSTAPTSSCGTRSAPPMSRARRTGPSCRSPAAASCSSRPGSSTATPPWTCRPQPVTVPPADQG